jgi:predicted Zn finger-like uncharacterized protein
MKIVCGSCQAKYSIADEKVAGKVFKIRCKRCGEVIVVRGDQEPTAELGSGNGAGNGAFESSIDTIWHVVVNGEQAGPYSPAQLADMLRSEQLDWEAYVWCEGFENWQPMRDVPELVAAISGQAEEPVAQQAVPLKAAAAVQASMGADPFADDASASVGMFAKAAAAAPAARGNAYGGGDVGVASSYENTPKAVAATGPRVSAEQAMTGARNENSVLFSLKNLQALATGSSSPAAPSGNSSNRAGFAGGEGSGLIDIRALATTTGVADAARHDNEKDALLSLGSAQAGAFGALGSPMLAPGKSDDEGRNKGLAIAVVAGVALLAVAGIAIAVILKPQPAPASAVIAALPVAPSAAATAVVPSAAEPPKPAPEPLSEGEQRLRDQQQQQQQQQHTPLAAAETGHEDKHAAHGGGGKHGAAPEKPSAAESDPLLRESAAPKPEKPVKKGASSIDDLLDSAIGSKGGAAKHESSAAADPNLQEKPTRDDVINAMNGVKDAVKTCGKGASGVAFANVTVVGKTGRISNAEVTGMPGEVGSCIARAVRQAKFQKFKSDTFQVKFPFRL